MINYLAAATLIVVGILQVSCQTTSNCGELSTIGDNNDVSGLVCISYYSSDKNILTGLSRSTPNL